MASLWQIVIPLASFAAEGDDPVDLLWERLAREQVAPLILGGSDRSPFARAEALSVLHLDPLAGPEQEEWERLQMELAPLLPSAWAENPWYLPAVSARGWTRLAEGDSTPVGMLGDEEEGQLSWRASAELFARSPWLEIAASPELRLDALGEPFDLDLTATRYWLGVRRGPVRAGFGASERRLGPGRRGNLILADDAAPWPAGTVAGEGPIWRLGRFRGELSAGWLQAERRDVDHPGLLFMDLRWSPVPMLELGASRASLFGGEGRPRPPIGQLLLPTEPHVYDDPEKELADQDEMVALDGRLTLPTGRLWAPLRYVDLWIEYGGEDVIAREIGSIPYPSLAGVANLRGAEVALYQAVLTLEWARLMDDTFRWYENHRVYHEGFTQSGHALGHPAGGDADIWWLEGGWVTADWGVQAWYERVWRVEIAEAEIASSTVFTLMADEYRRRYGLKGWWGLPGGGYLGGGFQLSPVVNEDFVPDTSETEHRVWIEWRSAPRSLGSP